MEGEKTQSERHRWGDREEETEGISRARKTKSGKMVGKRRGRESKWRREKQRRGEE